jgi:phosphoribosylformylglycinamidine cyclo-ligase
MDSCIIAAMRSAQAGMAEAAEAEKSVEAGAYRQAGVDIDAGARAVALMRRYVRGTANDNVLADVGYFGGIYALGESGQVLVASADGVGTKLKLAFALGTHRNAGIDIVNHCINDIVVCGAKPIFFLDYIASGKVVPEQIAEVVKGMSEACKEAGCALLGGETAEMPGMYHEGEYDVAGFIVGSAQRERLVLGHGIAPGDVVLGLPSNGLHTNGYSLARKVLGLEGSREQMRERLERYEPELGETLGEALTRPHMSYLGEIEPLLDMQAMPVKGMAHITGGGLVDNIPRILPEGTAVVLDTDKWEVPAIFRMIEREGRIGANEMARVFNMGLGMVLVVAPENVGLVEEMTPGILRVGTVIEQGNGARVRFEGNGLEVGSL